VARVDHRDRDAGAEREGAAELDRAGVWRVKLGPRPSDDLTISVNPDPAEAGYETLAVAEVKESLLPLAERVHLAGETPDALRALLRRIREGLPLWNALLVAVLALAVLEVYLGGRVRNVLIGEQAPADAPANAKDLAIPPPKDVKVYS
jgi:hypothetical protein